MTDAARAGDRASREPLLDHEQLPRFDAIRVEQVQPAIRSLIAQLRTDLAELERTLTPSWDGLVARLTALCEPLNYAWSIVNHLNGVQNSAELRAAHEAVQGEVVQVFMALSQSRPLYDGLIALRDGAAWASLDEAQQRVVTAQIRTATLAGVGLTGAKQERFQKLSLELAELSTSFSNNLLDATKAFALTLTRSDEVAGLPPTLLAATAQSAAAAQAADAEEGVAAPLTSTAERGPWRITLDAPIVGPFLQHARRRELREKVYRAHATRAAHGDHDNQPLVERILRLRAEQARLLGYGSHAEVSLAAKMAPDVAAIETLQAELHAAAKPKAEQELAELTAFARAQTGDPALTLALWDIAFWAERLRESRFAFTDEELRPYFSLEKVLSGLFAVAQRLFGIRVRAADGETPVWDPAVRFFRIADENGRDIAAFYLDPYSRPQNKRGGAWMDNALDRKLRGDGSLRLPVAYLVCNQTPPVRHADGSETPSLMTFREVETLFHEFGHGLQHMLTTVTHVEAAGINNVEWDAVELPSQFMENWCYHRPTVMGMARHWQTGVPLPDALFDKLVAARTYLAGMATLRQLYFSSVDLELHHRYRPLPPLTKSTEPGEDTRADEETASDVQRRVARLNTLLPPLPDDRMLCAFSHIFAGGYAAGYYSYKWAEVLSADAFGAFVDAGLDDERAVAETGRRFRDTVLARGGGQHPLTVFTAFRGRAPSTRPLLVQTGLLAE